MPCVKCSNAVLFDEIIKYPIEAVLQRCPICGKVFDDVILQNQINQPRRKIPKPRKIKIPYDNMLSAINKARITRGGLTNLAKTLGVSRSTLSYYSSNHRIFSIK